MNQYKTMPANETVIDTATLRRVGGQMGGNPAGIFQDENGRRYYVKTLESAALARNEWIAAALYRLAGAPILTYVKTVAAEQVATVWVDFDKKRVAHLNEDERKQAQQWFAVHAWTANWDVAGFDGDNQGVLDGVVVTIDLGGALEFRAQGDPKGSAFGTRVNELDALRGHQGNPHAVKLYAGMRPDDLRRSILRVVQLPDERIRQAVMENSGSAALADKMIARKADMALRLIRDDY